jgi:endonuclease/exonuclease/phosphatase family metal-dependent hydrolase
MNQLPVLSLEQRKRIADLPSTRSVHERLLTEMPFLSEVEVQPPPIDASAPGGGCRVVAWNSERCRRIDAAERFLMARKADLILLSEMDWGMARSCQLHTTRMLAERLQYGYAFAIEFLELGLGDAEERRIFAGQDNLIGYHGAAILFRWQPLDVRAVRLERSGGWFDGSRGERRVGGRIALIARFQLSDVPVTFASVHLESDTDAKDRAAQMRVLFNNIESHHPCGSALIGGDLNTFSVSHAELNDEVLLQKELAQDPERLANPVAYEPLFILANSYGYEWESANLAEAPTQRLSRHASSGRRRLKIDWFLTRRLEVLRPELIEAVDSQDGSELSDHDAIAVTVDARDYKSGLRTTRDVEEDTPGPRDR